MLVVVMLVVGMNRLAPETIKIRLKLLKYMHIYFLAFKLHLKAITNSKVWGWLFYLLYQPN